MKILLAVDGSPCSEAAVEEVAQRPWPEGSQVKIISAVELPFVPTPETWALPESYYSQFEEAAEGQALKVVNQAAARLRSSHGEALALAVGTINGPAKDVILDEAERWGADLIVIGSHGYRGFKRFLLGSVSQAVASHAKCSVEIVRCRASRGEK
jgi:nucleotide-binding universal stress UspA family protein